MIVLEVLEEDQLMVGTDSEQSQVVRYVEFKSVVDKVTRWGVDDVKFTLEDHDVDDICDVEEVILALDVTEVEGGGNTVVFGVST